MASLFGLVGIFLAAPVVATVKAVGLYVFRKILDQDPWPEPEEESIPVEFPWFRWSRQLKSWVRKIQEEKKKNRNKKTC